MSNIQNNIYEEMLVSMVMAVCNGERYLKETIEKTLAQTYKDLEIIIVNDGSTDSTKMILDGITDQRVKIFHFDQNQGAPNALNFGITQASGKWIAIQDADDISYSTRIEEQVKYLQKHPDLVGVGTLVNCISGDPEIPNNAYDETTKYRNSQIFRNDIRNIIFWGSPFTHSSVMFLKSAFWEVGGYDSAFTIAYDHDLWLKLLEKGEMEKVPNILLDYRIHQNSLSNKNSLQTVNEIQLASSKAIFRKLNQEIRHPLKMMVIGTNKGCANYIKNIAPLSGLVVVKAIFSHLGTRIPNAIRNLHSGKIDAIIVLDNLNRPDIIQMVKRNEIELNKQLFIIYNILE